MVRAMIRCDMNYFVCFRIFLWRMENKQPFDSKPGHDSDWWQSVRETRFILNAILYSVGIATTTLYKSHSCIDTAHIDSRHSCVTWLLSECPSLRYVLRLGMKSFPFGLGFGHWIASIWCNTVRLNFPNFDVFPRWPWRCGNDRNVLRLSSQHLIEYQSSDDSLQNTIPTDCQLSADCNRLSFFFLHFFRADDFPRVTLSLAWLPNKDAPTFLHKSKQSNESASPNLHLHS